MGLGARRQRQTLAIFLECVANLDPHRRVRSVEVTPIAREVKHGPKQSDRSVSGIAAVSFAESIMEPRDVVGGDVLETPSAPLRYVAGDHLGVAFPGPLVL